MKNDTVAKKYLFPFLYYGDAELKGFFQCVIQQKQNLLHTWGIYKKRTQSNPAPTPPPLTEENLCDISAISRNINSSGLCIDFSIVLTTVVSE